VQIGGRYEELDDFAVLAGDTHVVRLSRSTEASFSAARALTTVVGPYAAIIDRYLEALSHAPSTHLQILARRGSRIVFAPTVDTALTSPWAADRRGRELSATETFKVRVDYGPESGTAGIYDEAIDALVLPTAYCCKNLRALVLHELGHALTIHRAQIRPALIEGLPSRIRRHVYSEYYTSSTPERTLRQRALEALAEGYIYLIDGRTDELPAALTSELIFMLQTVEDGTKLRFEFEETPDGERTASRVSPREIIDASDPEHRHLFAPMRLGSDPEAWDLAGDELAMRRHKRHRVA